VFTGASTGQAIDEPVQLSVVLIEVGVKHC
jgi:hypothetical protein